MFRKTVCPGSFCHELLFQPEPTFPPAFVTVVLVVITLAWASIYRYRLSTVRSDLYRQPSFCLYKLCTIFRFSGLDLKTASFYNFL
jgi:hypothetical protein